MNLPRAIRDFLVAALLIGIALIADSPRVYAEGAPNAISFTNDVMAILSRSGCNQGACHGNARGKGGFQLSLRGQDPALDYQTLTSDWGGRRINLTHPQASLLLQKPLMKVAHQGGKRFSLNSFEHQILENWLAQGAPNDTTEAPRLTELLVEPAEAIQFAPNWSVALKVIAKFSNDSRRDVTKLAVVDFAKPTAEISETGEIHALAAGENTALVRYLGHVQPVRLAFLEVGNQQPWSGPEPQGPIDEILFERARHLQRNVAPLCNDSTFIRRIWLDVVGLLPPAEVARRFVEETTPGKRSRVIDELLQMPEFAENWARKWSDLLKVEEKMLDAKGVQAISRWLKDQIASDRPMNLWIRELVTATGSTYENPPANYYRALRDPLTRSETTAQLFLGVRLQCSKCHNHPFDQWTQDDYYAWGNVFSQVDYKIVENKRKDSNDKHEFQGEQIVELKLDQQTNDPRTNRPQPPKVLDASGLQVPLNENRLEKMGDWLTHRDNSKFRQALANRIWHQVFGMGIVDPVDDLRTSNPAVSPQLLELLSNSLGQQDFRLKLFLKQILNSAIYQLSSDVDSTNRDDESLLTHHRPRRLEAELLVDAMCQVAQKPPEFSGAEPKTRASQLPGTQAMVWRYGKPTDADRFLKLFGKSARLQACDCEKSVEVTLPQALHLIAGPFIQNLVQDQQNIITQLLKLPAEDRLAQLYWAALCRPPSAAEQTRITQFLTSQPSERNAWEDILWSLLNSDEFLLK